VGVALTLLGCTDVAEQPGADSLAEPVVCLADDFDPAIVAATCADEARGLLGDLSEHEQYADIQVVDESAQTLHFQTGAGLLGTGVLNRETMLAMRQEYRRLSSPLLQLCDVSPDTTPWTRDELVNRLAQMGAFAVNFGANTASRTDLLDPKLSSEALIDSIADLTHFAECNDYRFNVLLVNTGHARRTVSGNVSQHVLGEAIDIRPMNEDNPMSGWDGDLDDLPTDSEMIVNNPSANQAALDIMDHIATQPSDYHQVIWTDAPFAIVDGARVWGAIWSTSVAETHTDHLHISVPPNR
jgi:hypothetical protein